MRARRDTRGRGCVAVAVAMPARERAKWRAALCLSRASGSLLTRAPFGSFLAFFGGRCEPRSPGVGPVGLRVGRCGLCGEIALQKRAPEITRDLAIADLKTSISRAHIAKPKRRRTVL